MINRHNKRLADEYLKYRKSDQLERDSLRLEELHLRFALEWAGEVPFKETPKIEIPFPIYIAQLQAQGKETGLAANYQRKIISTVRRFFHWLRMSKPGYRMISELWLSKFKPVRQAEKFVDHEIVSLEEILAIAQAPVTNTKEQRIRAAAVFLFLSAMRVDAFVSLPIMAVDIQRRHVMQWTNLGVRTKNKKSATTFLFKIPTLLAVVEEWDNLVRASLPPTAPWFAPLTPDMGEIDLAPAPPGLHRGSGLRKDLEEWLMKVKLPYHSPHKFRHGHACFGLDRAFDFADMQAVSQNLMHEKFSTTEIYARQRQQDVERRIENLGSKGTGQNVTLSDETTNDLADKIISRMRGG